MRETTKTIVSGALAIIAFVVSGLYSADVVNNALLGMGVSGLTAYISALILGSFIALFCGLFVFGFVYGLFSNRPNGILLMFLLFHPFASASGLEEPSKTIFCVCTHAPYGETLVVRKICKGCDIVRMKAQVVKKAKTCGGCTHDPAVVPTELFNRVVRSVEVK